MSDRFKIHIIIQLILSCNFYKAIKTKIKNICKIFTNITSERVSKLIGHLTQLKI